MEFLEKKTLYYDKIDYEVIKKSWKILESHITLPYVIHIVGTNGKGSTGRFIASFLQQNSQTVLHYSSPHILKFNERIWIDGKDVSDTQLNETHLKLQQLLPQNLLEQLTYFEYTTLLAFYLSSGKNYLVLEAGLGGEFDATNVVKNNFSVFTTIDLDHQQFLGNTIEEIATTKMRSCDNQFILSHQKNEEVFKVKEKILANKKEILVQSYDLTREQQKLPNYLQNNLQVAKTVLDTLGFEEKEYILPKLFGRFQKLSDNIIIDVGHNPLAAKAVFEELKKLNKKIVLIYNSYKDKDYETVLKILSPLIQEVQIIPCHDKRIVDREDLENYIRSLGLNIKKFDIINLETQNSYFVFGSFLVVEKFLKDFKG